MNLTSKLSVIHHSYVHKDWVAGIVVSSLVVNRVTKTDHFCIRYDLGYLNLIYGLH